MNFGNFGPMELLLILVIVLVLFGARKVPEIGASIGKGIREFKRNISDVDKQVRNSDDDSRRDRLSQGDRDRDRDRDRDAVPAAHNDESRPEPRRLM